MYATVRRDGKKEAGTGEHLKTLIQINKQTESNAASPSWTSAMRTHNKR